MLPQNWQDDFAESLNSDHPFAEGASPLANLQIYHRDYQIKLIEALKKNVCADLCRIRRGTIYHRCEIVYHAISPFSAFVACVW